MLGKIQKFGGAMFAPVLLFAFAGLTVGITSLFKNVEIFGSIAEPTTTWFKIWNLIEAGGWTVFNQMPLLFAISLPIGLANTAKGRACMETFVLYVTFNYFVNSFLTSWDFGIDMEQKVGGVSGLANIANVKTLDTNIIGSIFIAAICVWVHNKFFDKKLPDALGVFQGSPYVVIVGFFVMIPVALLTVLVWPKVQLGISHLQGFLIASGAFGVWIYTFLERILIPTGLHHFIYGPFVLGPAVVENGITAYWVAHIQEFAKSTEPLTKIFPEGGFALHGNSKVFGAPGIALALYATAKSEKKKIMAGLLIPATLTAVVSGITEPLEFTFLFVAPVLFAIHAVLAATMSTIMYVCGVSGNMGGGLLDMLFQNWVPMFKNHSGAVFTQIAIGLVFTVIYFLVFRTLIVKLNLKTPGREDDAEETKLFSKADWKEKQAEGKTMDQASGDAYYDQAAIILEGLGGEDNLTEVSNCVTRLRLTVKDPDKVSDDAYFRQAGAHGVVRNKNAVQVIIGMSVQQVRDRLDNIIKDQRAAK